MHYREQNSFIEQRFTFTKSVSNVNVVIHRVLDVNPHQFDI